jgi:hypothetical protein
MKFEHFNEKIVRINKKFGVYLTCRRRQAGELGQNVHFTIYRPDSISYLPTTNRITAIVEFQTALRKEKEFKKMLNK